MAGATWIVSGPVSFMVSRDVHIHLHFHGCAEDRERDRRLDQSVAVIRERIAMISPQIQKMIEDVRQTKDLVKAVIEADKVQTAQIATLTDKVTELQAKLDQGGTIGPDDLAGIAEITSDIDMVNSQLRTAVPANTGAPAPADLNTGNPASGLNIDPAAQPDPPTPEEIAARGQEASDSTAKPLAGTGV